MLEAPVAAPAGLPAFATPPSFLIPKPGLLSTTCSPGYKSIVVLSTKSLSFPLRYENLAASMSALCNVLKGLVSELPWFSIPSVNQDHLDLHKECDLLYSLWNSLAY